MTEQMSEVMAGARLEQAQDGTWYGSHPAFHGIFVWAEGYEECYWQLAKELENDLNNGPQARDVGDSDNVAA
jgi:hypothetical protein